MANSPRASAGQTRNAPLVSPMAPIRLQSVIPCHRVIGAGGKLTGYGGGLPRKRWLLAHEGAISPQEFAADLFS